VSSTTLWDSSRREAFDQSRIPPDRSGRRPPTSLDRVISAYRMDTADDFASSLFDVPAAQGRIRMSMQWHGYPSPGCPDGTLQCGCIERSVLTTVIKRPAAPRDIRDAQQPGRGRLAIPPIGGMPSVFGRGTRTAATCVRSRLCTKALMNWVVPDHHGGQALRQHVPRLEHGANSRDQPCANVGGPWGVFAAATTSSPSMMTAVGVCSPRRPHPVRGDPALMTDSAVSRFSTISPAADDEL